MERVVEYIRTADEAQLEQILTATLDRRRQLYPDDELVILSLPKRNLAERHRLIDLTARMLKAEYCAGM